MENYGQYSQSDMYLESLKLDLEVLKKKLFDMVFTWGSYHTVNIESPDGTSIKVDHNVPAFKDTMDEILQVQNLIHEEELKNSLEDDGTYDESEDNKIGNTP